MDATAVAGVLTFGVFKLLVPDYGLQTPHGDGSSAHSAQRMVGLASVQQSAHARAAEFRIRVSGQNVHVFVLVQRAVCVRVVCVG